MTEEGVKTTKETDGFDKSNPYLNSYTNEMFVLP